MYFLKRSKINGKGTGGRPIEKQTAKLKKQIFELFVVSELA